MAVDASSRSTLEGFQVIVAATSAAMAIGKNGKLPWRLPGEMAHFKRVTSSGDGVRRGCIMGRGTWESIPSKFRPLPDRTNIVLSSSSALDAPHVCGSLDDALATASEECDEVYVIGGARVYEEAVKDSRCHRVHLTSIDKEIEGCDAFFPVLKASEFSLSSRSEPVTEDGVTYRFEVYDRIRAKKNSEERQYLDLVERIMSEGAVRTDRTGVGTKSIFGATMRFSLRNSVFPLLTTKRVFWRGVAEELLWFIQGCTDSSKLSEKNVKIWDGNGSREFLDKRGLSERRVGDLGPVYGFQWRHFGAKYRDCDSDYQGEGVDQLKEVIEQIKNTPDSRRIIMSAWNPVDLDKMALPPCHVFAQFYVANGELSCQMYQRSADMGLGVPFNIASYALLTRLIAHCTNLKPGDFVHVIGDAHVYLNHQDALRKQLKREPRQFPTLTIASDSQKNIDDFTMNDLKIDDYNPYPTIKMEMAV